MTSDILFDVLKNILQLKSKEMFRKHLNLDDFEKSFNRFMILRYLSMSKTEVSDIILKYQSQLEKMPSNKSVYSFLFRVIPQQKSGFVKYLK